MSCFEQLFLGFLTPSVCMCMIQIPDGSMLQYSVPFQKTEEAEAVSWTQVPTGVGVPQRQRLGLANPVIVQWMKNF